mmetsp:Transcript_19319/g.22456  ORF Transcript_19319/g.22456 Transcript_19319/m.22456 type:complete len:317 (+) Transcript_19319:2282-3232(+)
MGASVFIFYGEPLSVKLAFSNNIVVVCVLLKELVSFAFLFSLFETSKVGLVESFEFSEFIGQIVIGDFIVLFVIFFFYLGDRLFCDNGADFGSFLRSLGEPRVRSDLHNLTESAFVSVLGLLAEHIDVRLLELGVRLHVLLDQLLVLILKLPVRDLVLQVLNFALEYLVVLHVGLDLLRVGDVEVFPPVVLFYQGFILDHDESKLVFELDLDLFSFFDGSQLPLVLLFELEQGLLLALGQLLVLLGQFVDQLAQLASGVVFVLRLLAHLWLLFELGRLTAGWRDLIQAGSIVSLRKVLVLRKAEGSVALIRVELQL